jgi:hypothetical protein
VLRGAEDPAPAILAPQPFQQLKDGLFVEEFCHTCIKRAKE